MDVSVVIPTRNRPQLLALTLRTVLWQEDVRFEVLIVDDGESRDTEAVVRRAVDSRVRLLRNTARPGVSGARNTGIAAAGGDWIAFLDDDDLWAPRKLALQLAAANEAAAGWVYAGDVTVDEGLDIRAGGPPPTPAVIVAELGRHNSMPAGASNVMVRRHVLETTGGFDPELTTSEDWDLWLRLAGTGLPACVPRPLVALRTHAGMASRDIDRMLADIKTIALRHGIPLDLARHERWAAWMCLERGQRTAALRHYGRAIKEGDIASIGRAAVTLVYPGMTRRARQQSSDAWAAEAQRWLEPLRLQL